MPSQAEKELMVRELREISKGRFNSEETRRLLEHVKWEKVTALDFIMKKEPSEVRRITNSSEDIVRTMRTDPDVLEAITSGIKSTVRQFACEHCDNVWWWRVPMRKQVSKCKLCKQKYDPIPRENEWGWAKFDCTYCGHTFSAYGEMGVTICVCYQCGRNVNFPTSIIHARKSHGRSRRSGNIHSCAASNCTNRHGHEVPIHDTPPDRVYDEDDGGERGGADGAVGGRSVDGAGGGRSVDGAGGGRSADVPRSVGSVDEAAGDGVGAGVVVGRGCGTDVAGGEGIEKEYQQLNISPGQQRQRQHFVCLSPESMAMRKRVLHPSQPHQSTGSTVGTFLPQDDIASTYLPSLPSIKEELGRGRGRRGGGRGTSRHHHH